MRNAWLRAIGACVVAVVAGCGESAAPDSGGPTTPNFGDVLISKPDALLLDSAQMDAGNKDTAQDAAKSDAATDALTDVFATDAAAGSDAALTDAKADAASTDAAVADAGKDAAADIAQDVGKDTSKDVANCTVKPETCNELDDDCDGETDESCDDGEACTENDSCNFTSCYGTFKKCNDDDKCTADTCEAGNCNFVAYTCKDNEPCTLDTCDPATGCKYVGTSDACDDGDACTEADSCATGACKGQPIGCDDGNPCTADSCDKAGGCKSTPNTAPCDDGNVCTATDVCQNGSCVGSGGVCDDGNSCTTDSCDGGNCGHEPLTGTGCEDGNACTSGDACDNGTCVAAPVVCDDGLACTNDSCSGGQCVYQDNCQAGYKCDSASNACVMAGCALPTNACANGSQNRHACDKARVIGRKNAVAGWKENWGDSCSYASNASNYSGCNDSGYDNLYRIFLRKGEQISVKYTATWCDFEDWGSGRLVIAPAASGCGEPVKSSCSGSASLCDLASSTAKNFTAPAEGWYYIVADGDTSGEGVDYTLTVNLNAASCQVPGCECP